MSYGLPYKGSKNRLSKDIIDILPPNEYLVDLFAGGCSITHCGILSNKWNKFIINDISLSAKVFKDLLDDKINIDFKHLQWLTREEFFKLDKDNNTTDFLLSLIWSFGNSRTSYLYGKDKEEIKHQIFNIINSDDVYNGYDIWLKFIKMLGDDIAKGDYLNSRSFYDYYSQNEEISRYKRLDDIKKSLNNYNLTAYQKDYRDITIPSNSTIYCDIPYKNTSGYDDDFDYDDFYNWCLKQKQPVFVSEYSMPNDFVEIFNKDIHCTMGINKDGNFKTEKVFIQKKFYDDIKKTLL